ncbi:patatin family protein [Sutcliffiella horikoshii]|uniref:Patatin family protein n=1 Tax=Sutcliffiella horikoshii TaxID=79883 RepID=A0A1Y0CLB1_9BACI|nr:patatin family protein [Sutcliffiella horikoshii]ART76093.1 patatin family protein [Sutcliffiella horikoshii]TYS68632.1 patatin family protein [Sutcliffiella horikoshii]
MLNSGLVLEGGGMRGVYTAGILEYFMEKNLYFPYVIGVSAGACMAASYLSRQPGRNKKVNIDFVGDPRYLSYRNFWKKRQMFDMDFLFDEIPNKLVPYDYDSFLNRTEQFVVVTTDCLTGEPVYYNMDQHGEDMLQLIRASSSLPFVAPSVAYQDKMLLDGGIIDPIPLKKAQKDGFEKNVVILTKPVGYKKKASRFSSLFKYKQFPIISERLQTRYKLYNETLDYVAAEKESGSTFVFQPSQPLPVGRMERKKERLQALYELGYEDAKNNYKALQEFLQN